MRRALLATLLLFGGCAELKEFLKDRASGDDNTSGDVVKGPSPRDLCGEAETEAACATRLMAGVPSEVPAGLRVVSPAPGIVFVSTDTEGPLEGELTLATTAGFFKLLGVNLDEGAASGTVELPLDKFAALEGFSAEGTITGQSVVVNAVPGLPVDESRSYLKYTLETSGTLGALNKEFTLGGPGALVVIDPKDPAIFMQGSLTGISKLGPIEDTTLGLSKTGAIPFTEQVALDGERAPLVGNLFVKGKLDLPGLPLVVDGDTVMKSDVSLAQLDEDAALEIGSNGKVSLVHSILGVEVVRVDLADATVRASVDGEGPRAVYKGRPLVTEFLSLPLEADLKTFGGKSGKDEGFEGTGDVTVPASFLSEWVPLPDLKLKDAAISAGKEGIRIGGPLDGELKVLGVAISSGAGAELFFRPAVDEQPMDFEIKLRGKLGAFGVGVDKTVVISPSGVALQ